MIFGYLLLAHMLGDFVFQPGRLVAWKIRSKIGLAVHALIHFAITLLLFLPFFIRGENDNMLVATAAGVSLLHFCIDTFKIKYELKHHTRVYSFVIDQICHLIVIIAIALLVQHPSIGIHLYYGSFPDNLFYRLYGNIYLIIFLALTIFSTIGVEIYHFQQQREHDVKHIYQPSYLKILWRFIFVSAIYAFATVRIWGPMI